MSYGGFWIASDTLFGGLEETLKKTEKLIRLRATQDHDYEWSRTRKGVLAIAQSLILVTTITLKSMKQKYSNP